MLNYFQVKRSRLQGFSLAELMLAFVVLSALSVVLIGVVPSTIIGLKGASQRANAALIAQSQLEELRRSGFGALSPSVEPYPQTTMERTVYTHRVEVSPARLSTGELMAAEVAKQVGVVVTWESKTGAQTYVATAVMFKRI